MSSILADFLKNQAAHIRNESESIKATKLDWQRAVQDLVHQMVEWLNAADLDGVLRVQQVDHVFEDYDLGRHVVKGLALALGDGTVRIAPSSSEVVGALQLPGETERRRARGRVIFDNGTDRVPLYRVKDGDRDVWVWWSHGGIGKPFDRESFEATIVSLFR